MKTEIKVTNNAKKPNKYGLYSLGLRIKNKLGRQTKSIGVTVTNEHWDETKGHLKNQYWADYPEVVEYINEIYRNRKKVEVPLNKGLMTRLTAHEILTGKNNIKGTILEWVKDFKPTAKIQQATINKHITNIRAINTKLEKKKYKNLTPLEFTHLQDETSISKIADCIIVHGGLKQNTQASYIKSLNWVCTNAKLQRQKPFTEQGFLPSEKPSDKNNPLDSRDLLMGFNNVNTLQQYEAILWWLYSFCFLGLDGKDLTLISEDNIVTDGYNKGDLNDYIPESDILDKKQKRYRQPHHIHLKRKKSTRYATDSGIDAIFQVNLFPTLVIHELLKHAIAYNPDGNAYTGNDKLKLFNFDAHTKEGAEKWAAKRNYYSKALRDRFGTTTQRTRHTITFIGQRIGMSKTEIDRMLNHAESGTIKHYISKEQTRQDVNQMHIFQEYGLLEVVKLLIEYFKDKEHTTNEGDVIKYIPDSFFNKKINGRNVPIVHRQQILELGRLTKFSRDDEVRYQHLMLDALKGATRLIDGQMVRVDKQPEDYSDELKELIAKRNELYDDNRIKLNIGGKDIYTPDRKDKIKIEKNIDKQKSKVIDINKKVSNA